VSLRKRHRGRASRLLRGVAASRMARARFLPRSSGDFSSTIRHNRSTVFKHPFSSNWRNSTGAPFPTIKATVTPGEGALGAINISFPAISGERSCRELGLFVATMEKWFQYIALRKLALTCTSRHLYGRVACLCVGMLSPGRRSPVVSTRCCEPLFFGLILRLNPPRGGSRQSRCSSRQP
jgi:hypothetical protein